MPDVDYILGHSPAEIRRLILQAGILKPILKFAGAGDFEAADLCVAARARGAA